MIQPSMRPVAANKGGVPEGWFDTAPSYDIVNDMHGIVEGWVLEGEFRPTCTMLRVGATGRGLGRSRSHCDSFKLREGRPSTLVAYLDATPAPRRWREARAPCPEFLKRQPLLSSSA